MGKFTEFRRKIASRIVVYYYNRQYQKAVIRAEKKRLSNGDQMIYVIDHFIKGELLSPITRKEFRAIKHAAQKLHRNDIYWSNAYNTGMLKEQCWYHTANRDGEDGLTEKEKEVRRLAFLREGLKRARLYK